MGLMARFREELVKAVMLPTPLSGTPGDQLTCSVDSAHPVGSIGRNMVG